MALLRRLGSNSTYFIYFFLRKGLLAASLFRKAAVSGDGWSGTALGGAVS